MKYICRVLILLFLLIFDFYVEAQTRSVAPTTITGEIVDSVSGNPIPFAAIFLKGSDRGTMTDENGKFHISTSANFIDVEVSVMGYRNKNVFVTKGANNNITIPLAPVGVTMQELVVKPGKEKYSKKNNPAVAFVEKLRARKDLNSPRNHDFYSYTKYEKNNFAINDFSEEQKKNWLTKKFQFIFDYVDTSIVSGKPILNVAVNEKVSDYYYRRNPSTEKEYVRALKINGINEIFNDESTRRFMSDVFREIDIFGNDVTIMQNRFVSPLSNIGTNYYKYYLTDTLDIDGERCIELTFAPFNSESFGFVGRLYVPEADTSMFIKRVVLKVPKSINLNYVQNIYLTQDYEKAPDGTRLKVNDDMTVEFQIIPSTQGLYARRFTAYSNHNFNPPDDEQAFKRPGRETVATDAMMQPEEFWQDNRKEPIQKGENAIDRLLARLNKVPVFYYGSKVIVALVSGYVSTGDPSKFDFGPMNTTISGDPLEGLKLRVGGMTTANLSKRWFARGYTAYGFRDKKLKYSGELEYSFIDKKYHSREFPIHSIKASYKFDVDQLGQHYLFTNADNVFLAWKRKPNDKLTYQRLARTEYLLERPSGFSLTAGFSFEQQIATRFVPFETGTGDYIGRYNEASFDITLRYAPGEKFYQTKSFRYPINLDAPVFTLKQTFAPKGFLGSRYTLNKTEISVQKRFWFSAFGYTDIILKGGKVWSTVSFPQLLLPNANLSYTIQPESFALMNAMEFANDQYLSWFFTYWANGAILNRIPLIKYLKLREVFSFSGLYGSLDKRNNPQFNPDLFRFPELANCQPMNKSPYMEISVGLDNIFTFLRLDYVWRLTYRNTPGVDLGGLRIQLHFTF